MNANFERPSITFLNRTGDITLTWDDQSKEAMLALIEKKMKEGFTFFIYKSSFGGLRQKKVPVESIEQVRQAGSVTAPDVLAKKVMMDLGDDDVSAVVHEGKGSLAVLPKAGTHDVTVAAKSAQEVLQNNTLATRHFVGG